MTFEEGDQGLIGKEILGYHVDREIGSGGFGTVYMVSKTNASGTYVRALKHIALPTKKQYASVLNSMGGDYTKADNYFSRVLNDIVNEIQILSGLSESGNSNIVRYYENDIIETQSPKKYDIFILMEYLTPFPDYCEKVSLTVRDVIRLGKELLNALILCHGKKIVHRDIKDDNIFVSPDGVFKLGDFGVSKSLKDRSRAESVKGTPNFIAPEVYLGKEKYDNTVDLYSLGIVLYRLLNGMRGPFLPRYPAPYTTDDEETAFESRMRGQIPPLPIYANNRLGEAVLKAISPRDRRFDSAMDFLTELEAAERSLTEDELGTIVSVAAPDASEFRQKTANFGSNSEDFCETLAADPIFSSDETVAADGFFSGDEAAAKDLRTTNRPLANMHLFDTYSESANGIGGNDKDDVKKSTDAPVSESRGGTSTTIEFGPVDMRNVAYRKKATRGSFNGFVYLLPIIIAAAYVFLYLFFLPRFVFDRSVGLLEWLFSNPGKIIDALKDPSTYLNPIYMIIGLKLLNWLFTVGFIGSLFLVGRAIQNKKPKASKKASVFGNEAYLTAMELCERLKVVSGQNASVSKAAMQRVCERLKNESEFGYGSEQTIRCEKEIADCLGEIDVNVAALCADASSEQAAKNIEILCQRIMGKLKLRIELKKK